MSEVEREALMQTSRDWAAAVAAADFERALTYWTDDAIVLAPDAPAIVGKAAIRDFIRLAASMPGFSITWRPELAVTSKEGDMAYMVKPTRPPSPTPRVSYRRSSERRSPSGASRPMGPGSA